MKERDDQVNRLLRGVEVPPAPPELRALSLQRARAALAREPNRDPWRRAWENRRLRWAWAVGVVALVVANLALPGRHGHGKPAEPTGAGLPSAAGEGELAAVVALPRIDSRHLQAEPPNPARRLEPSPAADPHGKENKS